MRTAVGGTAVEVEHIGSTSVAGLAAKPIIDILVTVPDITAEEDYLEPLVAAGYVLRVREPGHRMVRTEQRDCTSTSSSSTTQQPASTYCCAITCESTKPTASSTRRPSGT